MAKETTGISLSKLSKYFPMAKDNAKSVEKTPVPAFLIAPSAEATLSESLPIYVRRESFEKDTVIDHEIREESRGSRYRQNGHQSSQTSHQVTLVAENDANLALLPRFCQVPINSQL
ncbi:hypothetical protein TNCV_3311471 [Trichonephila clavipes]|nr:hypothetical protein TNCV_3311471 [Trichonephila clavipes]